MANTLKNIDLDEKRIIIRDKYMEKLLLVSSLTTAVFLLLYSAGRFKKEGVDILMMITGTLGLLLLIVSIISILWTSWKKEIKLSEIAYIQDKTAFNGHRSLILQLKNKKIKNLYLENTAIPELLRRFEVYNIPVNAKK